MSDAIFNQDVEKPRRKISSPRGWTVLRLIVAAILLFAAGMKAWQLATVPTLGEGLLHTRWFNICVVEFELAFGIWLIFGLLPRLTWLATVGLFTVFGGVSLYKALSGEASCGCFGAAQVNPWITMGLDMTIVGLLTFVSLPHRKNILYSNTISGSNFISNWTLRTGGLSVAIFFLLYVQVLIFSRSSIGFENFASVSGISFVIDLGNIPSDNNVVFISVKNNTDSPIAIIGAELDCKCGRLVGLPCSVEPRNSSIISFVASTEVNYTKKAKQKQKILFFVDSQGIKKVLVELSLFDFLLHRHV